jgi:3alpha(or 20beta)-hydroxysteroid dehydrogenase
MARFTGKIVLVTCAAGGQGAEEALRLVSEGARVVIADILEDQGRQVADSLGNGAGFKRLDVASETDWQAVIAHCPGCQNASLSSIRSEDGGNPRPEDCHCLEFLAISSAVSFCWLARTRSAKPAV